MIGAPVYLLQIVDAERREVVTFNGRGKVEQELVTAITGAVLRRGGWWLRASRLEVAITEAIDSVLMDLKREASAKHLGT